jgi:hypothetical protein
MSDSTAYGLVEIIFPFGVILAIAIWQLIVTRRSLLEDRERAARETPAAPTSGPDETGDDREQL